MRACLWPAVAAAVIGVLSGVPAQARIPQDPSPAAAQPPYGPDNPRPGSARADLRRLMQEHPGEPMPDNRAVLDGALAQDPGALLKLLLSQNDPGQIYRDLNWERARIYDGAGLIVSLAYMLDTWREAPHVSPGIKGYNNDTPDGLRETAVAFALYNTALVQLDGTHCADPSAPGHRMDQLMQLAAPILVYGRGMSATNKATAVTVAINVERATFPARKDDPVLCSGGLDEIRKGLAANNGKPLPEASQPGVAGATLEVPDAPGYEPAFLAPDVWRPRQRDLRPGLRAELAPLIAAPAAPSGN